MKMQSNISFLKIYPYLFQERVTMPKSCALAKSLVKVCFRNFVLQSGSDRHMEMKPAVLAGSNCKYSPRLQNQKDKPNDE